MNRRYKYGKKVFGIVAGGILLLVVIGISLIGPERILRKFQSASTAVTLDRGAGEVRFPELDMTRETEVRQRVGNIARHEFITQPTGTKYSEGTQEPWCADFVSWVMREGGVQLTNPHSGGWRIPGTFTLLDYYRDKGVFHEVGAGYIPRPGDMAIYRASPVFGDHTNIVLRYEHGVLTTVGGNENSRVRVFVNHDKNYQGLLGYAELQTQ